MAVFGALSKYYNLIYKDKDYREEVDFVRTLIMKHVPESKRILNLGCGTGRHDISLVRNGYRVTGIDQSEQMLEKARASTKAFGDRLTFIHGDIRDFSLGIKFDVVISLFHVMCYQTTNHDIKSVFACVKKHLKPGGIFIFDCWYGPAVLTDRPVPKIKEFHDDKYEGIRIAEPDIHPNANTVDVNYTILIKEKSMTEVVEIRETHRMRYLFKPEIDIFSEHIGLKLVEYGEWLLKKEASFNSWNVYFILRFEK